LSVEKRLRCANVEDQGGAGKSVSYEEDQSPKSCRGKKINGAARRGALPGERAREGSSPHHSTNYSRDSPGYKKNRRTINMWGKWVGKGRESHRERGRDKTEVLERRLSLLVEGKQIHQLDAILINTKKLEKRRSKRPGQFVEPRKNISTKGSGTIGRQSPGGVSNEEELWDRQKKKVMPELSHRRAASSKANSQRFSEEGG